MFQKQGLFKIIMGIAIVCLAILFVATASSLAATQEVKTVLFKEANAAMQTAKKVNAEVLSPTNFGEAMKRYQEAETDLQQGKNLDDIRKKLNESRAFFQKAIDATKLAEVTFTNSIKARKDAQFTESPKFASSLWTEAEKKFNEAASILENGNVSDARKRASEAEKLYRQAELDAIKTNYLQETWALLKQADQLKVKDHAPKTLLNAQELAKQAEKELNENRYDTDVARSLALQAKHQAKHAIYLANTIKQMQDKKQTWEDVMLAAEKPLQQIAEKTDLVASFDSGFDQTTGEIITYIVTYQDSVDRLSQDLDWYQQESDLQEARITEMEREFGSQAKEKSALAQQLARQAKTREVFANVERSFRRDEARVLREGNDVIIRLVGLNFPSAKATLEPQSFGMLTKVRDAINSFPECTVSVLGHTDSYGSDEKNLELSNERAEAVKQYLLANSNLVASRMAAFGYGESKPIASNETAAGRNINRRVELVIHLGTSGTN
jgi:outer membrane protein OmpA-like peptidoglycan-associated protein